MAFNFDERYEEWKKKKEQPEGGESFNFDERYAEWKNRNGYTTAENEFAKKDMNRVLGERDALYSEAAAYPYSTRSGRQSTYASNKQRYDAIQSDLRTRQKPASSYLLGGESLPSRAYAASSQDSTDMVSQFMNDRKLRRDAKDLQSDMRQYERGVGNYQTSKVIDDYAPLKWNADFEELSAKRNFSNPTKEQIYAQDWRVHANEENFTPAPYQAITDRLGLFLSASKEDRDRAYLTDQPTEWEKTLDAGFSGSWDYLSKDEIKQYYYLLNRDGKDAADKYLDDMKLELNRRQAIEEQKTTSEKVRNAGTLEKLAMSAASVPAQLVGSVVSFADDLRQGVKGEAINPYSGERFLSRYASTVRGTQSDILDEKTGGWKIPGIEFGLGDLYQAGMSILDMAAGSQLGAFGYGTVMGAGAAASEAERLYQQGASDEQIQMGAALAGIAEMLFEEVSLDKLINMPSADSIGQVIKNVLIQGGIEASEEGATEIANTITNAIVMGKDSDFVKSVEENGGDIKQAIYDKLGEIGKAMAGGFVAGAGSGGAVSGINYAGDVHVMQDQGKPIVESYGGRERLMSLAKEASEGTDPRTQRQLQSQSDTLMDKSKSGASRGSIERAAGRLFRTTQNAMSQANQKAMAEHLIENGYDQKTAKRIAKDLGMQERGVMLSEHEQNFLERHIDDERIQKAYDAASEVSTGKNIDFATDIISNLPIESEASTNSNVKLHNEQDIEEDDYQGKALIEGSGEAEILRPAGIENGKLMVETSDGQRIDNSSLTHQSVQDQAIYDAIGKVAKTNEDVDFLYKVSQDAGIDGRVFGIAIRHAAEAGMEHQPFNQVIRDEFVSMLPQNAVRYAYNIGSASASQYVSQRQAENKYRSRLKGEGIVTFEDGVVPQMDERQKASLSAIETIADALGVDFEIFESKVNEQGKRVGENGFYDPKTGKIHIDLHAGNDGNSLMLYTASHELTHFIRDWSPEKFQKLADFLMEEYGKRNVSVERLIQNQIAKAKSNGRTIDHDTAYEEMVADSMESMLSDPNVTEKILKLKQQDRTLWEKIKDWFADLARRIREAYKNVKPDSEEGKIVAQMKDSIDHIQDLFVEGLADASETSQKSSGDFEIDIPSEVKFSMRSPVEQTKDLIAVHNLSEDKLLKAIRIGGFPMPSIAILKAEGSHTDFGDISLVFRKETIDPKNNVNAVYSADAWTPTYPQIEYKANESVVDKIKDKYKSTYNRFGADDSRPLYKYTNEAEDLIQRAGGEEKLINQIYDDLDMMQLFRLDSGMEKVPDEIKKFEHKMEPGVVELSNFLVKELGEDLINESYSKDKSVPPFKHRREFMDKYKEQIRSAWQKYLENDPATKEIAKEIANGTTTNEMLRFIIDARNYLKNNGIRIEEKVVRGNVKGETDQDAYKKWVDDLFLGIVEKEGIRNQKDLYTPSGNRRKWDALHYEHTLENVVKAMKEEGETGIGGFGGGNIFGASTQNFSNIDSIHDAEKRLKNLSQEEFDHIKENFRDRFRELVESIPKNKNSFSAFDDASNMLVEAIQKYKTKSGIADYIRRESEGWANYNEYIVDDLISLVSDIRNMPTAYFEAKPQRAVRFDEVAAVVAPDSLNAKTYDKLKELGLNVVQYKSGDTESRRNALNSLEDVKFSERTNEEAKAKALQKKLERQNKALKEDVSYLREMVKLQNKVTNGTIFTRSSVETAARSIKKQYGATGNSKELANILDGFYKYIAKGENLTWEYLMDEAQPAVDWVKDHTKKVRDSYAQEVLDSLKGRRFKLDESQKAEVAYMYGSYNEYRKANMGRFIISDKANTTLDQLWQELSSEFPAYFDSDVSASDMPGEFADVINRLSDSYSESDMYSDELGISIANDVYNSYWNVSTMHTVADKYQKQITELKLKHDEKVLSMNEKLQAQKEKYQESRAKGIDSRRRTEMRGKIKKVVGDLNKILLNPTKERHIPEELRAPVAEVMEAVNFDTVGAEERIGKLMDQLKMTDNPDKVAEISRKIDHVKSMGERSADRLGAFRLAYQEISKNTDPVIAGAFDPDVSAYIEKVQSEVGNTALRDMNLKQLDMVYKMFRMVKTTISNANKSFADNLKIGIEEQSKEVIKQFSDVGGDHQYSVKMLEDLKKFGFSNLKPLQFFQILGSGTLEDLFRNVRAGEDNWAVDISEAKEYAQQAGKKYGLKDWNKEEKHTFTSRGGDKFDLTLEQIMSIYAYSKRGDIALDHLRNGGIVLDKSTTFTKKIAGINVKFNPNTATAYSLSDETIGEIIGVLTDEQRGYVDTMQQYLSKDMAAKGNEVSMKMYGIKLFGEKFYFPLMSAGEFMSRAADAEVRKGHGEVKIKNMGMTKATKPKSGNPVILANFSDVWANHVDEMSLYHSLVLPMEDFEKVWNYHTVFDGEQDSESVKSAITNAYGNAANDYIGELLRQLNGGVRSDPNAGIVNKLTSAFKKGAVFASASVVIQQPSAIARALYMIDAKYFAGNSFGVRNHESKWNELKKYAPIAIIKEMGGFDTGTGQGTVDFLLGNEYQKGEKIKAFATDTQYRDEVIGRAPAYADEIGWIMIWEACKKETAAKNPGLNGDELLKVAGNRFTDVVINTQVYDSVMTRSGLMRSQDTGVKMITAFMAEPTTSLNMIVSAAVQAKRGKKGLARKAIGAVVASQVLNAVLVSLVYAARDDDDNETYAEKYIGSLTAEILEGVNPVQYIPIAKDIASLVQGYDVERTDVSVFADIVNAYKKLGSENVSAYRKVEDFAGSIAKIFGLPVKNVMRDARALYQMFAISPGDTTKAGVGYAVKSAIPKWAGGGEVPKQQKLYDAILSGDKEQIRRMQAQYSSESSLHTAIRNELKKRDPRITEAAKLYMSGKTNDYTKLFREIQREGFFSFDDIQKAINSAMSDMKSGKTSSGSKHAPEQVLKSDMLLNSIIGGSAADRETARKELHDYYVSQGDLPWKADNAIASSVTSQVRSAYMDGNMSRDKAEEILSEYGSSGLLTKWDFEKEKGWNWSDRERQYRTNGISKAELRNAYMDIEGKTAAEADAYIRWLDLQSEYPTIEITQSDAEKFYDIAQPAGIPFETFREFLKMASSVTGVKDEDGNTISGSKKESMLELIDSMPISNAQKDALYYSQGYSVNTIREAPWRS